MKTDPLIQWPVLKQSIYLPPLRREYLIHFSIDIDQAYDPLMPLVSQSLHLFPLPHSLLIRRVVHLVEACVVPAAVAFEACSGFERVDHEAVASAGGDQRGLLGAGAAGWDIRHL